MSSISEFRLYICNNIIGHIPSHRIRLFYYRTIMGFKIGANSSISMRCRFDCARGLSIGSECVINAGCRIDSRGTISIENNVAIAEDVIILTADHSEDWFETSKSTKSVTISDYSWVGTRAMILPGITLGRGAVVAAGAVVTKNIPPLTVVAGVPARKIKDRPDQFNYVTAYKRLFQ